MAWCRCGRLYFDHDGSRVARLCLPRWWRCIGALWLVVPALYGLVLMPFRCGGVGCARQQKNAQDSIAARLQLTVKSGKYTLGYRSTLKTLRSGKGE